MEPHEQLIRRCMMVAELEGLQGNAHLAELLQDCMLALSESPPQ